MRARRFFSLSLSQATNKSLLILKEEEEEEETLKTSLHSGIIGVLLVEQKKHF